MLTRFTDGIATDAVEAAADLLTEAVSRLGPAGRPLGAANAALPAPREPLARLWQAATTLREHRGDGHVAALVAAELGGCEPLVWRAARDLGREVLQPNRGWSDQQWEATTGQLVERGGAGRQEHVAVDWSGRSGGGPFDGGDVERVDAVAAICRATAWSSSNSSGGSSVPARSR